MTADRRSARDMTPGPTPSAAGTRDLDAFASMVLDASGLLVAVVDRHGTIAATNATWDDTFRPTPAGVLLRAEGSLLDGMAALNGGDADAHAAITDVFHGRRLRCSVDVALGGSTQRWLRLRVQSPAIGDGQASDGHVVVTALDVTAARHTEKTLTDRERDLRVVVESVGVGIARLDADLRVVSHNAHLAAMFGEPDVARLDLRDLVHVDDVARLVDALRAVQAGELVRGRVELRCLDATARPFWCSVTATAPDRELTIVVEDIDERRRLESDLRRSQRLEAIGRLASGLAHEVRTPLQFIGDNLRFVQREVSAARLPAGTRHALADALTGVQRIVRVADALRTFGARRDDPVLLDLTTVVGHAVAIGRVEMRSVEVVEQLDEVPLILGREAEMSQVVLGLVLDAAAHASGSGPRSADGRGRVTLSTGADGGTAWLRILCERHRTASGEPDPAEGAPIELARTIVEEMGGALTLDADDHGWEACISFPPAGGVDARHGDGNPS